MSDTVSKEGPKPGQENEGFFYRIAKILFGRKTWFVASPVLFLFPFIAGTMLGFSTESYALFGIKDFFLSLFICLAWFSICMAGCFLSYRQNDDFLVLPFVFSTIGILLFSNVVVVSAKKFVKFHVFLKKR